MSTIRAPQHVEPRRAPGRRPQERPELRVVQAPARRYRTRAVVAGLAIVVVFVALLASAVFHALLAQGQQRLDKINQNVATQQEQYEHLRYQVAQLSAPQTIVGEATDLGMVQPTERTLLTPPATAANPAAGDATASRGAGASPWAIYTQLKPYLGSGR
jgi:cell division protein FtsL